MVGDIWPLTFEMDSTFYGSNGWDSTAANWEVGYLNPNLDVAVDHPWSEEQASMHSLGHMSGRTTIRVSNCQVEDSDHMELPGWSNHASNFHSIIYCGTHVLEDLVTNEPVNVDIHLHNYSMTGTKAQNWPGHSFYLYSGNFTVNITDSSFDGTENTAAADRSGDASQNYGFVYGGALTTKNTPTAAVDFALTRSRFHDLGYKGPHPEDSLAYGVAFDALQYREQDRLLVELCEFDSAFAPGSLATGGAVYLEGRGTFTFLSVLFSNNHAGYTGGAIFAAAQLRLHVVGCVFIANVIQPPSGTLLPVLVDVYTGGTGATGNIGRSVWRIDDGPVYGNYSYQRSTHYAQWVSLEFGSHTLHHGIIPSSSFARSSWLLGTIELKDIFHGPLFVEFEDTRNERFNCLTIADTPDSCPYGTDETSLWSSTEFWVGGQAGGAISTTGGASVYIESSTFLNNSATVPGSSLEAVAPIELSIRNTSFSDTGRGELEPLALKGAPRYDCGAATDLCSPGRMCTFSHFSVFCQTCSMNQIGDGQRCRVCEPGTHPSMNQTACEPCPPGTVGKYGMCVPCTNGLVSSDWGGIDCDSCPPGQVSSLNATNCVCSFGRYNRTNLGFITCTNNDFEADAFDSEPIYAVAKNQVLLGLQCVECPLCE